MLECCCFFKFTAYFLTLLRVWDFSLYFIHIGVAQHGSLNKTESIEQWLCWQFSFKVKFSGYTAENLYLSHSLRR